MNIDQLIEKYYKKITPGTDGFYSKHHLKLQWKKDKKDKIKEKDLEKLLKELPDGE